VRTRKMRCTRLQSLSSLHQCLDAICIHRSGETFAWSLHAFYHRQCHPVLYEVGIDIEHLPCLCNSLFSACMRGMSLLPEKLRGAKKEARTHLPTNHVRPLVDEQRQVAV